MLTFFCCEVSISLSTRSLASGSLINGSRCERCTSWNVLVPGLRHNDMVCVALSTFEREGSEGQL